MNNAYVQGFIDKCADAGVDPSVLSTIQPKYDNSASFQLQKGPGLLTRILPTTRSSDIGETTQAELKNKFKEKLKSNVQREVVDRLPFGPTTKRHLKRVGLTVKLPYLNRSSNTERPGGTNEWGAKVKYEIPF